MVLLQVTFVNRMLDVLYDEAFGAEGAQVWSEMPSASAPPIDVYIYPPRPNRSFFTFVTEGISTVRNEGEASGLLPFELVMYMTPSWTRPDTSADSADRTWPLDLLRELGRTAHARSTVFEPTDSIPNRTDPPSPYAATTALAAALILPLPAFDAHLSSITVDDRAVSLLRVLPITAAELAVKKREGTNALLARFRDQGISVAVDPQRRSVV